MSNSEFVKKLEDGWSLNKDDSVGFYYTKPVVGGELMITKVSEINFNRLYRPYKGKPEYWDRLVILNPAMCLNARTELTEWFNKREDK